MLKASMIMAARSLRAMGRYVLHEFSVKAGKGRQKGPQFFGAFNILKLCGQIRKHLYIAINATDFFQLTIREIAVHFKNMPPALKDCRYLYPPAVPEEAP